MIKVLFLTSNPEGTPALKLDEEVRLITQKIRASEYRDVLKMETLWAVRNDDLLQALNEHKPQIVHFSGHGSKMGEIVLMDKNRQIKPVSAEALKMLFTTLKDNIRLVMLNACYSQLQAQAISEVIDCTVGMSTAIGDDAAIIFPASFYRAIGFGRSIKEAFDQGKTALMLEGIFESNTPQLLTRMGVDPSSMVLIRSEKDAIPLSKLADMPLQVSSQQKPCPELGDYLSNYTFYKAIQQIDPDDDKTTTRNPHGTQLLYLFDKAFKRITASDEDFSFMNKVFCYPSSACDYAAGRVERLHQKLSNSDMYQQDEAKSPVEAFYKFREEYLNDVVNDLINLCNQSLSTENSRGIEKILLWVGEKGCGKTTFVNYILLNNKLLFDEHQIIWVRYSVFFTDPPKDTKDLELKFCNKVIRMIKKYYTEKLNLTDYDVCYSIWSDKLNQMSLVDPDKINKAFIEYEKNDPVDYLQRLIKYINSKRWSFLFILDNIDQYDDANLARETIKFGVKVCNSYGKNVLIMVSRIDTVNEHLDYFRDVYSSIRENIFYIPSPDFNDVFEKRLSFLENHLSSPKQLRTFHIENKTINLSEGYVARNLTKYFLTRVRYAPERFLIGDLANSNIRDIFKMIKSILSTHLLDVTEIPLGEIYNQYQLNQSLKRDVIYDDTLRNHLIIWALMLKNYLYYKDDKNRSFIMNIYSVRHETESYWLKRLLLDFFIYLKEKPHFKIKTVSTDQIKRVFLDELAFNTEQLEYCLYILSDRVNIAPLLWKEKAGNSFDYRITPKGELFSKYIAELFIYLELILEDTLLPTHPSRENSVFIEMIPYEPMQESDFTRRKNLTINNFLIKKKQVDLLSNYLECREIIEKKLHNNFESRSTGFKRDYFPKLGERINKQVTKISKALNIE